MKKIFLTTAIFIAINNFCFSQDEEKQVEKKNLKPSSRIGGTVGMQILHCYFYAQKVDNGIGVNLFFHQTISPHWFFLL